MVSNSWGGDMELVIDGDNFCWYLGSYITNTRSCETHTQVWIGKANSTFGRLAHMEKNEH